MRGVSFAAVAVLAMGWTTSCSLMTSFDGFGGDAATSSGGGSSGSGGSSGGHASSYRATVLADKPLAYWRFGEASGTTASDETGNGNTATIGSGVVWGAPGALMHDSDTAVHLTGGQCLLVANTNFDFPGTNAYSLEGWVNLSAPPDNNYRHLYIKDDETAAAGRQEYGVYLQVGDGLALERFVNGSSRNVNAPAPPVSTWTYFVATYDGLQLTFYINAANVGVTRDTRSQLSIQNPEYLGCKDFQYPGLEGDVDEFAIYNFPLSQTQISAHYMASGR
jgi:hypothetical protein